MDEGFQQLLATIIERCLGEKDMAPPFVVRSVGHNGSILVIGVNEAARFVLLTDCDDVFTLPINITITGNSRTAHLVIEADGNIGRLH